MNLHGKEIKKIKKDLANKRKEFEKRNFNNLSEKLEWINLCFDNYIKNCQFIDGFNNWISSPGILLNLFYSYFPEHGINTFYLFNYIYSLENSGRIKINRKYYTKDMRMSVEDYEMMYSGIMDWRKY